MTKDATGESTATSQAAADQVDNKQGQAQPDVKADDTKQDQMTTVPLSALTKLRGELQQVKEQNILYQTQMNVMRSTGQQPMQQQAAQPQPEVDPFEGLEEDDVLTVADVKKALKGFQGGGSGNADITSIQGEIAKLKLTQQDPNYEDTIRTYLPEILNTNPGIANMIQSSPNPLEAALTFARMSPRYQALKQAAGGAGAAQGETLMDEIDRIISNAEKPGSASQVSGSGAIGGESKFKDMTPEQIEEHKNKVITGLT